MIKLNSNSYSIVAAFFAFLTSILGILGRHYILSLLWLIITIICIINFISKRKKIS